MQSIPYTATQVSLGMTGVQAAKRASGTLQLQSLTCTVLLLLPHCVQEPATPKPIAATAPAPLLQHVDSIGLLVPLS